MRWRAHNGEETVGRSRRNNIHVMEYSGRNLILPYKSLVGVDNYKVIVNTTRNSTASV